MPWDIAETATAAFNALRQWLYLKSPDQQSKRLDNEDREEAKEIKERRLDFLARMRRYLAGKNVLSWFLLSLLFTSCVHPFPEIEKKSLQSKIAELEKERNVLKDMLLECADRLGEVEKCGYSY